MAKANPSGRRNRVLAGAAAAVLAVQGMHQVASAAMVTFNTPQTISGASDVSTAGSVLYAYDLGETMAGAVVNGVTFTAWAPNPLPVTGVGSPVSTPDGQNNATLITSTPNQQSGPFSTAGNGGTAGAIGAINTASPAYYNFLNTEEDSSNSNSACTITLTLQNLSPGTQYQFEFWVDDSRGGGSGVRFDTLSSGGGTSGNILFNTANTTLATGVNGVGEYDIGTFTADGSSQAITITGGTGTGGSISPQLAGFDVETLTPEPASAGLIVLALSTLACRRGRRRRLT
jgi:hypothetical protein